MARTLRLSDEAQAALGRITAAENVSANAAINAAILEYDEKRREVRDRMHKEAAKLRIITDAKLGKETPRWVKKLAS